MEQSLVYVQYGHCCGLAPLTGVGRIAEAKYIWNALWVLVEPVEGMPLPKWVLLSDVQYVLNETAA